MNRLNYPYPVLEKYRDDIKGEFTFNIKASWDTTVINITVEFVLKNDELQDALKKGSVLYFLQIECKKTFYREIISFNASAPPKFQLNANNFKDQIEFKAYLGSAVEMNEYQLKSFHDDYSGYMFSLAKGDILAFGGTIKIIIDKEYDELFPVKSFMEIIPSSETQIMRADYDADKIIISLPQKEFDEYVLQKKLASGIFHSAIVLPVLVEALTLFEDENLLGNKWHSILERLIAKRGINPEESKLKIAQEILSYPLIRTLENIKKINGE